jgi:type II secretory pathway predicted ATPase ExeA
MARMRKADALPRYLWPKWSFVPTRHSTRMWEVIDTVRAEGSMGLVCGVPGVGKTVTAKRYGKWGEWEREYQGVLPKTWKSHQDVKYVAVHAANTPMTFLRELCALVGTDVRPGARRTELSRVWRDLQSADLDALLIDEADRLGTEALEVARDLYDRTGVCVILMGMPGLEKKLERLSQLYSRIGFYYPYAPLTVGETAIFMAKAHDDWAGPGTGPKMRSRIPERKWTSNELAAIEVIHRATEGIPREICRMVEQIERLVVLNDANEMNPDIAREAGDLLFHGKRRWPKSVFVPGLPKPKPKETESLSLK